MSNYFDLECLDCTEKTPEEDRAGRCGLHDANRGHKELWLIMQLRHEYEALGLAFLALKASPEKLPPWTSFDSGPMFNGGPPIASFFFAGHVGHHVIVRSEYGDAYFGCEKEPDTGLYYHRDLKHRENRNNCRLDFNHEGPCALIRPDGK